MTSRELDVEPSPDKLRRRNEFRLGTRAGDYISPDVMPYDKNLVDTGDLIERPETSYVVVQNSQTLEYFARDINAPLARLVRAFPIL